MSDNQHWGVHLLSAVAITVLLVIIFQPSTLEQHQSQIIEEMKVKQQALRLENDSVKNTAAALMKQLEHDPQPKIQSKYIERDEAINNIQEIDVPDNVLAVLQRRRAARLEQINH